MKSTFLEYILALLMMILLIVLSGCGEQTDSKNNKINVTRPKMTRQYSDSELKAKEAKVRVLLNNIGQEVIGIEKENIGERS